MLPDRSVLIGQKLVENAKIQKFKCDILSNFQTMWKTFFFFVNLKHFVEHDLSRSKGKGMMMHALQLVKKSSCLWLLASFSFESSLLLLATLKGGSGKKKVVNLRRSSQWSSSIILCCTKCQIHSFHFTKGARSHVQ